MTGIADALSDTPEGTVIAIEVTAGGKKEAFPAGYNAWRKTIGCRVTAPALEGRANKAVAGLVARALGRPVAAVSIVFGATSSQKRVLVEGIAKEAVLALLEKETAK